MEPLRKIKNKIGILKGYGSCSKCGDTWDRTKYTVIPYDKKIEKETQHSWYSGMFPLCKKCFDSSDKEQILQHCILLLNRWEKEGKEEIIKTLKHNIDVMKG